MDTRIEKYKDVEENIKNKVKNERKSKRKKKINKFLIFIISLFCICIVYSRFIEPKLLIVYEHKITNKNITSDFHGFKIVHITDLHFGSAFDKKELNNLVKKINILKPDIIVFTGDLVDRDYISKLTKDDINCISKGLFNMNSTLGKYAILGNHDYKNKYIENIYYDSKFMLLKNNYDIIYGNNGSTISIYGFDDVLTGNPDNNLLLNEEYKTTNYKIVLIHEPDYINNFISISNSDLVLSGHSHGGQINIPFVKPFWLPIGAKNYYKSYYKINNTDIYISNGLGESTVNLRFLSVPSINLYRLIKK